MCKRGAPANESRAAEIRQRLAIWKQTPESLRPSLRALARALGTSHQLLQHYLDGLDIWQERERWHTVERENGRRADAISARAQAEGRPMTEREMETAAAYGEKRWIAGLSAGQINQEAKPGPLKWEQI